MCKNNVFDAEGVSLSQWHYINCVCQWILFILPTTPHWIVLLRPQYQMIIAKANKYLDQPQQYLNVPITPAVVLV